jgi:hypothetical protein
MMEDEGSNHRFSEIKISEYLTMLILLRIYNKDINISNKKIKNYLDSFINFNLFLFKNPFSTVKIKKIH